jgi:hypothetical protein
MSDLTINNVSLQAILETVNSLPEAGSGGSSGGDVTIEMCTARIILNAPNMTPFTAYAINNNLETTMTELDAMSGGTFQAVKGTIITVQPWSSMSEAGLGCTKIFGNISGFAGIITDDCELTYNGC